MSSNLNGIHYYAYSLSLPFLPNGLSPPSYLSLLPLLFPYPSNMILLPQSPILSNKIRRITLFAFQKASRQRLTQQLWFSRQSLQLSIQRRRRKWLSLASHSLVDFRRQRHAGDGVPLKRDPFQLVLNAILFLILLFQRVFLPPICELVELHLVLSVFVLQKC